MKNGIINTLACVLSTVMFQVSADSQVIDLSDARVEYLESGELIKVPKNAVTIPGQPLIIPEEYLEKIKAEKIELERFGFVDESGRSPIALYALRGMRDEFRSHHTNTKKKTSSVYKINTFDFSQVRAGKVDPEILTPKSEAFVIASQQSITRVYSKTKLGDIYINEMIGAEMGVIGGSDYPNFRIGNIEGYKTMVRYEHGKMATLVLLKTSNGVTFVEIGDAFTGINNDLDLQKFISVLVTVQEGG